jgi:hypothetical protein
VSGSLTGTVCRFMHDGDSWHIRVALAAMLAKYLSATARRYAYRLQFPCLASLSRTFENSRPLDQRFAGT